MKTNQQMNEVLSLPLPKERLKNELNLFATPEFTQERLQVAQPQVRFLLDYRNSNHSLKEKSVWNLTLFIQFLKEQFVSR